MLATTRHGRDVKWLAERKYPISPILTPFHHPRAKLLLSRPATEYSGGARLNTRVGLGWSLALPRGFAEVRGVARHGRWLASGFGFANVGGRGV